MLLPTLSPPALFALLTKPMLRACIRGIATPSKQQAEQTVAAHQLFALLCSPRHDQGPCDDLHGGDGGIAGQLLRGAAGKGDAVPRRCADIHRHFGERVHGSAWAGRPRSGRPKSGGGGGLPITPFFSLAHYFLLSLLSLSPIVAPPSESTSR